MISGACKPSIASRKCIIVQTNLSQILHNLWHDIQFKLASIELHNATMLLAILDAPGLAFHSFQFELPNSRLNCGPCIFLTKFPIQQTFPTKKNWQFSIAGHID
jgi:hypothetical protein